MFPKSRVESVSSSISPITALPIHQTTQINITNHQQSRQERARPEKVRGHLHVVASDDVKSQNHLLHALAGAEDPLVTLVQDQVDGLIEAFQGPLKTRSEFTDRFRHRDKVLGV